MIFVYLGVGILGNVYAAQMQQEISDEVLRFHVLANSDRAADQEEKLAVRNGVIAYLSKKEEQIHTKEEMMSYVQRCIPEIEKIATEIAFPHKVKATLGKVRFPEKSYGEFVFPEGVYDALQLKIGEAKGKNWWCVLYPALCFRYAMEPVVDETGDEKLQEVLSGDAYDFLKHPERIKISFHWF